MHTIPGRRAAWLVIDVRDVAAVHAALLEPGRGPVATWWADTGFRWRSWPRCSAR
ncbi:oxidoreductase domain protein [Mycobacterium kansasii]|uniref:Oxidoreductase domain protein n=1 Tax=Mycobacterium kansasii TaxID=1768 RepID=A0A1V3XB05_MYCKA|nr:oxidoreductase domain protein [Mycobacterium kansasii]